MLAYRDFLLISPFRNEFNYYRKVAIYIMLCIGTVTI